MNRALHATTPGGDEVTLEANAQLATRGRTVAQVEHNAMQALDLVRATLTALTEVSELTDRLSLLLSHGHGMPEATVAPELQRVIAQLGELIHGATTREDPLLCGGGATFAVEDPQIDSSTPLRIELPDLEPAFSEVADVVSPAAVKALLGQVHAARKQLTATSQRLSGVLASQRPPRPVFPRVADDGFVALTQSVRESVLHAGDDALRVQGSPSARATWLIEARKAAL
jgi:hypothetical protein